MIKSLSTMRVCLTIFTLILGLLECKKQQEFQSIYIYIQQIIQNMQTTSSTSGPTKSGLPTQIKISEIIKLILQFLEQQGLSRTFDCLQKQSKISLNIIDKHVVEDIINTSNWEHLFKQLNYLTLPEDLLFDIYQLVIDDIIDKDNIYVAKLLCDKLVSGFTAIQYKERKLRIQYICQNPTQKAMYHKPPSQHRRETIINRILKETHQQVEKSRLLTLITSALKYEASKGLITPNISYSLLEGKGQTIQSEIEQMITKADKILRFSEQSRISCIQYSNKGAYIAMGGIDGLIELYQPLTYTLETRTLKYQQQGFMLYHEDSIEHLQFNETDEMLASVDKKNVIKIWNMETGKLLRKLQYGSYIGCFAWGIDSSQLFIGYHNVQMFGVRSMGLLGEFVGGGGMGGQDYLLKLAIATANNMQGGQLFTFSQSATIRRYNIKTQQQSNSLNLANQKSSSLQPSELLKYIIQHTRQSSVSIMIFHVCFKKIIITVNQKLQQINKYQIDGSGDLIQLCNVCFVRNYIYEIVSKDVQITKSGRVTGKEKIHYVMQVRQVKTGRIVYSKQIQQQVWIMEVHPFRNLLAMYTADHMLTFLRP